MLMPSLPSWGLFVCMTLAIGLSAPGAHAANSNPKLKACQMHEGSWAKCPTETLPGVQSGYAFKQSPKASRPKAALVLLAGGPGQAATDAFFPMSRLLFDLSRDHDLIFFNPRGTSGPQRLTCPQSRSAELGPLMDRNVQIERARACVSKLGASQDLNQFGTDASLADLDHIREELGYEKLSFYGISYGTRLALRYAALYPNRVEKSVLEGILPPEALIGIDTYYLEGVLRKIAARCRSATLCLKAFGDPWDDYTKLIRTYETAQIVTTVHPVTGVSQTFKIDRGTIEGMILAMLYTEFDQTMIPSLLHEANRGNFGPLLATLFTSSRTTEVEGVYYAIACTEDVPFYQAQNLTPRAQDLARICGAYPFKAVNRLFHDPIRGAWPTLLLSGELDPVTAPILVEHLKEQLTASEQLIVPNKGHNVFYLPCVAQKIVAFLKDDSSQKGKGQGPAHCPSDALPFMSGASSGPEESKR
ncbi:MAG: alpha/beta fold hydrolase [Chitinophagaceae bacterium]|nr:alpha/beta fold hydrolase [Oligoflexus sp.]